MTDDSAGDPVADTATANPAVKDGTAGRSGTTGTSASSMAVLQDLHGTGDEDVPDSEITPKPSKEQAKRPSAMSSARATTMSSFFGREDSNGSHRSNTGRVSKLVRKMSETIAEEHKAAMEIRTNRHQLMLQVLNMNESEYGTLSSSLSHRFSSSMCQAKCRKVIRKIVLSQYFDLTMALVVGVNSLIMALESETEGAESVFEGLDWFFNVVYSVEAFCRWTVYRQHYLKSAVNILDLVIVICGWLTSFAAIFRGVGGLGSVGALKVLRALRALRFCRMISFFEGIWLVFSSFMRCMRPLFWTCLFVAVIIFIFTMFAVELIGTSTTFDGVEEQKWFAGTVIAFVSLFQVMTLDEWRSVTQPICDHQWWTYLFFLIYVCVAALALMNLVTAVIVENAMLAIREDEDARKRDQQREQNSQKDKILQLFRVCHRKISSAWSKDSIHMTRHLYVTADDVADMKHKWGTLEAILESFAIEEKEDIQMLMDLLDTDGNGSISLSEMLEGILDLRSVMEDHNRIALLHTTQNREHKFQIIERLIAQKRAPEICSAGLKRIQEMFKMLGMIPPEEAEEDSATDLDRFESSPPAQPEVFDEADACAGKGATSVPQGSFNDPPLADSRPTSAAQILNTPSVTKALLQRIRGLRFKLQHQSRDLRNQRQEIERLEQSVDNLLQSSPSSPNVTSRPGTPGFIGAGNARGVPLTAPRSTLDETPPT